MRCGLSLLTRALIAAGLMWGCAGSPDSRELKAPSGFVTFERGDRVACCGVALPDDGSVVVVGRVDSIAGKSSAWAAKILRGGEVAWERAPLPDGDSTSLYGVTEIAGAAVIGVGQAGRAGLVARIEPTGTIAWTKLLRMEDRTKVTYVVDDPVDGLLIGGAVATGSKPWSLFVARMTASGDVGAHTTLGEGDEVTRMRRVDKPLDGYVVISAGWDVIGLDRSGHVRWRRRIDGALDAVGLSDGSIMVLAYPENGSIGAGLVRLDAGGAKVWEWRVSNAAVCHPAGIWRRSNDYIVVVSDPCGGSEYLSVVSMSSSGGDRSVHRIRVRAGVSAAQVRFDAAGSVIAAGMFAQDGPQARKGWVFRSEPIRGLAP